LQNSALSTVYVTSFGPTEAANKR